MSVEIAMTNKKIIDLSPKIYMIVKTFVEAAKRLHKRELISVTKKYKSYSCLLFRSKRNVRMLYRLSQRMYLKNLYVAYRVLQNRKKVKFIKEVYDCLKVRIDNARKFGSVVWQTQKKYMASKIKERIADIIAEAQIHINNRRHTNTELHKLVYIESLKTKQYIEENINMSILVDNMVFETDERKKVLARKIINTTGVNRIIDDYNSLENNLSKLIDQQKLDLEMERALNIAAKCLDKKVNKLNEARTKVVSPSDILSSETKEKLFILTAKALTALIFSITEATVILLGLKIHSLGL